MISMTNVRRRETPTRPSSGSRRPSVAANASGSGSDVATSGIACERLPQLPGPNVKLLIVLGRRQLTTQIEDLGAGRLKIFAVANALAFLTVPPDAGRHLLNCECFDEGL